MRPVIAVTTAAIPVRMPGSVCHQLVDEGAGFPSAIELAQL